MHKEIGLTIIRKPKSKINWELGELLDLLKATMIVRL